MATLSINLDPRGKANSKGERRVVMVLRHKSEKAYINLGITLNEDLWDAEAHALKRNARGARAINLGLQQQLMEVTEALESRFGRFPTASVKEMAAVATAIIRGEDPDDSKVPKFADVTGQFTALKVNKTTIGMYEHTLSRIGNFLSARQEAIESLTFEAMDLAWLESFEAFLARTASKNARNIHLRNIRAVFNFALDHDLITVYPFRRFKIRPEATRKRSLSADDIRRIADYPVEAFGEIYRDMFMLTFMLCGINAIDLFGLKEMTAEGRIEYKRAKTHKPYSIKVEPEAAALINKWRGKKALLCMADRYEKHSFFLHRCNIYLGKMGVVTRVGRGGKKVYEPEWPGLTTYWARHSWATIAASLDIPKETIAAALGHGGNTVTDIYIDFDRRKIDEANRRVLDWVMYGKK